MHISRFSQAVTTSQLPDSIVQTKTPSIHEVITLFESMTLMNQLHGSLKVTLSPQQLYSIDKARFVHILLSDTNENLLSKLYSKLPPEIMSILVLLESVLQQFPEIEKPALLENLTKLFCNSLGHEWGLCGYVPINGIPSRLEGARNAISHMRLAKSVACYFAATHELELSPASKLSGTAKQLIQDCLKNAPQYMNHTSSLSHLCAVKNFNRHMPVTMGATWPSHMVEVTLFKSSNDTAYLVYTNRGEKWQPAGSPGNMTMYKITHPENITTDFIKKLAEPPQSDDLSEKQSLMKWLEGRGTGTMYSLLGLQFICSIPKSDQKGGYCSFANAKGGFHAIIVFLMMDVIQIKNPSMTDGDALKLVFRDATTLFKDWELFSRTDELSSLLFLERAVLAGVLAIHPKDYFHLIKKISTKIAMKLSYRFFDTFEKAEFMRMRIKANLMQSLISLHDCVDANANPIKINNFLNSSLPGSFVLRGDSKVIEVIYKNEHGVICCAWLKEDNGSYKYKDITGICTIGDLMTKLSHLNLINPITIY